MCNNYNKFCFNINNFRNTNNKTTTSMYNIEPVTSYGIIAIKIDENYNVKFLMIQRKYTYSYIEFIRGKYNGIDDVILLIKTMVNEEIQRIYDNIENFDYLWKHMWRKTANKLTFSNEYKNSKEKFYKLWSNEENINLLYSLSISTLILEWGFPKGRKNKSENNLECALREFEEETNFDKNDYVLIDCNPYYEIFYGTNNVKYKYVYYLALITCENYCNKSFNEYQMSEISDINLFNFHEAINLIDPFYVERKKILCRIKTHCKYGHLFNMR